MQRFSAHDAKAHFGKLLDTARREPVTIEKHGRAVAVVIAVGDETEVRRDARTSGPNPVQSGVEQRLRSLIDLTGPVALGAGVGLVGAGLLRGRRLDELVGAGVSLAVASVPEGLPLLATAAQLAAESKIVADLVAAGKVKVVAARYDLGGVVDRHAHEGTEVVELALKISEDSGGAFDPTIGPAVNLWGFGPDGRRTGSRQSARLWDLPTRARSPDTGTPAR